MQVLETGVDVMAVLKAATADQHRSVEGVMPFFNETLSLDKYTRTLRWFLGFQQPVERRLSAIAGWREIGLDLDERLRAPLLRQDLQVLGMADAEIAALPECANLPRIENLEEGLGCLYVLEGSTLGGRFIARELGRRFGMTDKTGSGFFNSYGQTVGSMWAGFCSVLRGYADSSSKQVAVVRAARSTFTAFDTWMQKADLHER